MEVTEVRIRIIEEENAERLRAFATITLDNEFLVRDMKVIEGNSGIFVAMPSRKITERCVKCGTKNHSRANYCNECGQKTRPRHDDGRVRTHVDIAHPITQDCRQRIHKVVIEEYEKIAPEPLKEQTSPETD